LQENNGRIFKLVKLLTFVRGLQDQDISLPYGLGTEDICSFLILSEKACSGSAFDSNRPALLSIA
jgi:hypothetical protein